MGGACGSSWSVWGWLECVCGGGRGEREEGIVGGVM